HPCALFEHRPALRRRKSVHNEAQRLSRGMRVNRLELNHLQPFDGLYNRRTRKTSRPLIMSVVFRLLTESDVKSVLTMDDLIEAMSSALKGFSTGRVVQPVRTVIAVDGDSAFFGSMPALARDPAALGAKLVTVFGANAARGLHTHLATIVLLDPATGALVALLDGRYITESRTAAVSAVSSRLLARKTASSLAIIGSGVQAHSHLEALSRVHRLRSVSVWSPNADRRRR